MPQFFFLFLSLVLLKAARAKVLFSHDPTLQDSQKKMWKKLAEISKWSAPLKPSGRKSINHMFLVQQAHSIPISLGDMNGDSACSGGGDNEQQQLRDDAADTLLKAHMQSQGIMVVINGPTIRFSFPLQRRHCRLADSSCCSNNPHPSRASRVCVDVRLSTFGSKCRFEYRLHTMTAERTTLFFN